MSYKMLCLDIDGTLLNSNHEITSETKQAIQSLPQDFPVILVSARMPKGIVYIHKELQLHTPIICYSGAMIMDIDQSGLYQPILNKTMSVAEVKKIEYLAKRMNVHISFYVNDEWYVEKLDYWAKQEQDIAKTLPTVTGFQALYHLFDRTNTGPNKVLCMGDEDEIERLELSLKKEMYGELTVYRSKPTYLEIMHHTVSKTSAIRFLHEKLKIKQSEIIAVGDNFNDIDMLQYSGIGVAMGNAPKQVKEIADKMTLTNDDHGVAKVIEKYLL